MARGLWMVGCVAGAGLMVGGTEADAASIAVFGENQALVNLLNAYYGPNSATTLTTGSEYRYPLAGGANQLVGVYDAFVYLPTTPGSPGSKLPNNTVAAGAINEFVSTTGTVVLLNGRFDNGLSAYGSSWDGSLDSAGIAAPTALLLRSIDAAVASGNGYVGLWNGAFGGLSGIAQAPFYWQDVTSVVGLLPGQVTGDVSAPSTPVAVAGTLGEDLLAGLDFTGVFGSQSVADFTGLPDELVGAYWGDSGIPAVIARVGQPIPTPSAVAMGGVMLGGLMLRRRQNA